MTKQALVLGHTISPATSTGRSQKWLLMAVARVEAHVTALVAMMIRICHNEQRSILSDAKDYRALGTFWWQRRNCENDSEEGKYKGVGSSKTR